MGGSRLYGVVRAGSAEVAIPADVIQEVVNWNGSIFRNVQDAGYMLGFFDFRGRAVPALGLRQFIDGATSPDDAKHVVILHTPKGRFGIAIDAIHDVIPIASDRIQRFENQSANVANELLDGVFFDPGTNRVIRLFNVDACLEKSMIPLLVENQASASDALDTEEPASRYLCFDCLGQDFCLDIAVIHQIVPKPEIKSFNLPVPLLHGMMNLREEVVPVIDLLHLLGLKKKQDAQDSVIVLSLDQQYIGILASGLTTMKNIRKDAILEFPIFWHPGNGFLHGVLNSDEAASLDRNRERTVFVLDHDAIFRTPELKSICRLHAQLTKEIAKTRGSNDGANDLEVLVFQCDDRKFITDLCMISEVRLLPARFMKIENGAESVVGLITFGGVLVPLVCVRKLIGKPSIDPTEETRVLVVWSDAGTFGFVVDKAIAVERAFIHDAGCRFQQGMPDSEDLLRAVTSTVMVEIRRQMSSMTLLNFDDLARRIARSSLQRVGLKETTEDLLC